MSEHDHSRDPHGGAAKDWAQGPSATRESPLLWQGNLEDFRGREQHGAVQYQIELGGQHYALNPWLGHGIALRCTGRMWCRHCATALQKRFGDGYCYTCFTTLAQCDLCVRSPDRCHFAAGTCREPEWGQSHCMRPHLVYLANSSGLKVGITRAAGVPQRWLDQGAVQGMVIADTSTRQVAGLLEAAAKRFVADRTEWRQMIQFHPPQLDMRRCGRDLLAQLANDAQSLRNRFGDESLQLRDPDTEPVWQAGYPAAGTDGIDTERLDLFTQAEVAGRLQGIKGQYLLLDRGAINLRRYVGCELVLKLGVVVAPVPAQALLF